MNKIHNSHERGLVFTFKPIIISSDIPRESFQNCSRRTPRRFQKKRLLRIKVLFKGNGQIGRGIYQKFLKLLNKFYMF
jgi:hypothetical protein